MSEVRVSEIITETALAGYSAALSPLILNEPLIGGYSEVRASLLANEPLVGGYSNVLATLAVNEPLIGGYSHIRAALAIVESLIPIPPEYEVVTAILPGFGNSAGDHSIPEAALPGTSSTPGLAFTVHMKPTFNTRVSKSVNNTSIRNPLQDYAFWDFDCPYEFLDASAGAGSSLNKLLDFYCARMGPAYPFLVKCPDFYLETNARIGAADGTRLQWDILRWIGAEYFEPVGQVDLANTLSVFISLPETLSVPGSGPYTVTVAHAAAFVADLGVTHSGVPLVKVAGSPATGQYSVTAGVYTFNAAQAGQAMVISYRYLVDPAAYTVTLPNKLVFLSAPAAGGTISWAGQYFFTCYFNDDVLDLEKFAKQLWQLQSLTFHSELLA
jgi:hypothetical protein